MAGWFLFAGICGRCRKVSRAFAGAGGDLTACGYVVQYSRKNNTRAGSGVVSIGPCGIPVGIRVAGEDRENRIRVFSWLVALRTHQLV